MSKPYMLTYDLNSPGQNYDEVIKTIENDISTVCCKYWESSYLFRSNLTTKQMIDKLKPYLDKGDRFFITEIVNNKTGWLTPSQWDFINENIYD
ncbi:MAG: hypothetical protein L0I64_11910 [Lactococcus lactis]|uniref:hypothetical protein n=1 Tax=Lactococcus TaxID=1357 RepID=UPI0025A05C1D|nr:hypothetical protein [Lactococcus lactis]MDM7503285.1 hypothetical protein [Lactococcus lactis]MDM7522393.1 hypothetical protein [Lactococcus lactis]MDN6079926.1 hypothetical protein [Lactococcus lactis]MDN6096142.1 hypothetical protein [Lactococcus lactis]